MEEPQTEKVLHLPAAPLLLFFSAWYFIMSSFNGKLRFVFLIHIILYLLYNYLRYSKYLNPNTEGFGVFFISIFSLAFAFGSEFSF